MSLFGVFLVIIPSFSGSYFPTLGQYGDLESKFSCLVWMQENADQKNAEYRHFYAV